VFECTVPGSTLKFEAGETQTAASCTITGISTNRITLTRISGGTNWGLDAGASPTITYCNIEYGNYVTYLGWTSGTIASPYNQEGMAGTTSNFFTGFTWSTSAVSTVWTAGSNWTNGIAPPVNSSTTVITIPVGASYYPLLTASITAGTVTIASGATLDLAGQNFTANEIDNSGTLRLHGSAAQTVTVTTKTNQTGSTVEYYDAVPATEKYGGSYTDATLRINKTGGSWSTTANITADVVDNPSTSSGTITLSHNITATTCALLSRPVTLGGAVTISGSAPTLTLNSAFDGAYALTVDAGTGTVTLGGLIGDTAALASLTVTGVTAINTTAIKTTGNQIYNSAVTLGAGNLALESSSDSINGFGAFT
jgi:hypothetical protein